MDFDRMGLPITIWWWLTRDDVVDEVADDLIDREHPTMGLPRPEQDDR